jgi:hypothetical protein
MHEESGGVGHVVRHMPRMRDLAEGLRNFLTLANVTRYELHHTDETRKALTWRDLRATGITWMAIRGDDALHIQHHAGHSSFSTTQGYIRQAEAVRKGFGDVFPALDLLVKSAERSKLEASQSWRRGIYSRKPAERAGFESAESVEFTSIRVDSRKDDPTRVDVSAREQAVIGPNKMHSAAGPLTVEDALAVALARASAAHEWAVVAQLARELEARRLSAAGVRSLLDKRGR